MSDSPSTKQLIIGGAVAAVVAAVVLVVFVLPAEFGVDPTGAGDATGLSSLSADQPPTVETGVFTATEEGYRTDHKTFDLRPYEAIEYKYTLEEGAPLVFSWRATDEVEVDMHSHPFEGGEELTETFSRGSKTGESGVYLSPFTGIHGWYWHNRTLENVTVTIDAAGFFTASTVFDESGEMERPIDPVE